MLNVKTDQFARAKKWISLVSATLFALACSPSIAGVGDEHGRREQRESQHIRAQVLPAKARPHGYSLDDMARATAAFNVTDHSGPIPNTPFKILFTSAANPANAFQVEQGKYLYVPLMFNDNSLPIIGDFPSNAENRHQLLKYWFSQSQFGVVASDITVDGVTKDLGGDYVSGVSFASPLADGATQYGTTAAFIRPLPPGTHTIEIHAKATGDALREPPFSDFFPSGFFEFRLTYTVTVY